MSNTTISFNNITCTFGDHSIIVGDVKVERPAPGAINIMPLAPQVASHIVFSKNDDTTFKSYLQTSPVRQPEITLYDHHGQVSCRYASGRKDNSSGNLRITESKYLLSDIVFPKIQSGQLYLVITRYDGLEQVSIPESKKSLVRQDLELLVRKVDTSKIVLFIADEINNEIKKLGINLNETFQEVFNPSANHLIQYLVEYLVGKSISGSKSSFQGLLTFGSPNGSDTNDVNIVMARFVPYDNTNQKVSSVSGSIRRGGRLQLNSEYRLSHSRFIIVIKHPENYVLKASEETTNTEFELIPYTAENLPDLTYDHFRAIIDSVSFLEKLSNKDSDTLAKVISENCSEAGKHMFNSPLKVFENLESKSDMSSVIIEYGCILRSNIYRLLNSNANAVNVHKNQPNKKYLMFYENDPKALNNFGVNRYNHPEEMGRNYTQYASQTPASMIQVAPSTIGFS